MDNGQLNWIANFIWGIADDVLRGLRARAKQQQLKADLEALQDEAEGLLDQIVAPTASGGSA